MKLCMSLTAGVLTATYKDRVVTTQFECARICWLVGLCCQSLAMSVRPSVCRSWKKHWCSVTQLY